MIRKGYRKKVIGKIIDDYETIGLFVFYSGLLLCVILLLTLLLLVAGAINKYWIGIMPFIGLWLLSVFIAGISICVKYRSNGKDIYQTILKKEHAKQTRKEWLTDEAPETEVSDYCDE